MKKLLLSLTLLCASLAYGQRDPKMDAFIDDLMSKMTLDEKLGQLNLASGGGPGVVGAAVGQDEAIRKGYLSATGGIYPAATQKAQEIAVKETRLRLSASTGSTRRWSISPATPVGAESPKVPAKIRGGGRK